jgi:hypothetical protein
MPKAILMTFTGLNDAARQGEYDKWYDEVHIPEVLGTPGFVSARRFSGSPVRRPSVVGELPQYLTVYDLDTEDLQGAFDALDARVKTGDISKPPEGLLKPNTEHEPGIFEVQFESGDAA